MFPRFDDLALATAGSHRGQYFFEKRIYKLRHLWWMQIGAPPDVVVKLAAARQEVEARQRSFPVASSDAAKDPELDQFMVSLLVPL